MGQFSNEMRKTATDLCKELGNKATLTKVTPAAYNPSTGNTPDTTTDYPVYTGQSSHFAGMFPNDGTNTNLTAFHSGGYIVPWFGQEIDTTWLYNGGNIKEVSDLRSQGDIIAYNITVGEM